MTQVKILHLFRLPRLRVAAILQQIEAHEKAAAELRKQWNEAIGAL